MAAASDPKSDLWAFREGRKNVSGPKLVRELKTAIHDLFAQPASSSLAISALMRAGELESALGDADSVAQVRAGGLTEALATVFLGESAALASARDLANEISRLAIPDSISISPPEGFAYYALHPHDFARLVEKVGSGADSVLIIGIRSIGTTLSAIVRAALQQRGKRTTRITVRPAGHPYDRVVNFSTEQLQMIGQWNSRGADFLVVDEGPGRSGSSFLSVAEALTRAAVPGGSITLLGSRPVEADQLCAENAQARWSKFRFTWPEPAVYTRFSNHIYIAGGSWREEMLQKQTPWPACWPQMERLKFLSPDRRSIFKFEGFGRFGDEVLSRAAVLAESAFGCVAEDAGDGMIRYPVIMGRSFQAAEVTTGLIQHLARYCAFRAAEFREAIAPPTELPAMLAFNTLNEFGIDLGSDMERLCTAEPIRTDGRMQPHEWICGADGRVIKVDACTHGDDHFFPGPTDIAWDLAGAIVEWNLDDQAASFLTSEFRRFSGLDRGPVIRSFILAYTVFQLAYWKMALSTVTGSPEEERVRRAYQRYRVLALHELNSMKIVKTPVHSVAYSRERCTQPRTTG